MNVVLWIKSFAVILSVLVALWTIVSLLRTGGAWRLLLAAVIISAMFATEFAFLSSRVTP